MSNFFDSSFGDFPENSWRNRRFGRLFDAIYDAAIMLTGARNKILSEADVTPRLRVLIIGVSVPSRVGGMDRVVSELTRTKHDVAVSIVPMADAGKFENLNTALAQVREPLESFDWIIATDDDVGLAPGFLDHFLALARSSGLKIAQPAHRFRSYCSWWITQRHWGSLVRQTRFVEIGPLTAFHRDIFYAVIPFPTTRWCFGVDAFWADMAQKSGWKIGIVDATPVEHQRPAMQNYSSDVANAEGREFLKKENITVGRHDLIVVGDTVKPWMSRVP